VKGAGDVGRVAARVACGREHALAHGRVLMERAISVGGYPAVGKLSGHPQCAVAKGAQPDRDRLGGFGLQVGPVCVIQPPAVGESLPRPQAAGNADGLLQAVDLVPRGESAQPESTELLIRVTAAQPEDQPATRQPAERLGHLGDHRRVPIGHTEHPGGHPDPRGGGGDPRQHRPRFIGRFRPARVVGGGYEIEPQVLRHPGGGHRVRAWQHRRRDAQPEGELAHRSSLSDRARRR
jgi:hypothetical protein